MKFEFEDGAMFDGGDPTGGWAGGRFRARPVAFPGDRAAEEEAVEELRRTQLSKFFSCFLLTLSGSTILCARWKQNP